MHIVKPPDPIPSGKRLVFLAGSIEMDKAEDWQNRLARAFADTDLVFLNPRRDAWDSNWEQRIDNPHFAGQVNWELDGLEAADLIVMYFDPGTKSPISMLELGLFARTGKMLVCCPEGFWRKGNVDVVCRRYGVAQAPDFEALLLRLRERLG